MLDTLKKIGLILVTAALLIPAATAWATDDKPAAQAPAARPGCSVPIYYLPEKFSLCGEEFPMNNQEVYERMDLEFTIAVYNYNQVILWFKRAGRYFPHIEKRLKEEGLPDDLKYLAVAESDLRPHVYSPAKALGTWQFIASTGRHYGLRADKYVDERLNFEMSTEAAIKYLKKLKNQFGSWLLAMAAYNCGEGCVINAMKEQGVNKYFRLDLPRETERYVYRIASIKMILDNPQAYGYSELPVPYPPLQVDKVAVNLSKEIHFTAVAKAIGTDYKRLKELNPEIMGSHLPKGAYIIQAPNGLGAKMTAFLSQYGGAGPVPDKTPPPTALAAPAAPQPQTVRFYVVQKGDTLSKISQETGVPMDTIRRLNGIKGNIIGVGQKLRLSP